jgi:glycosyltransferase involved in cell wall biosynthesis
MGRPCPVAPPPIDRSGHRVIALGKHARQPLRQIRPDALHANLGHPYQAQYPLLAAFVTCTPAVAVVHGILPRTRRHHDLIARWLVRRVRVVAGVSQFVCQNIESEYRLPPGTARVLYSGVEHFETALTRQHAGPAVLGAVGRCAPEKGFDVLIRALAELPDCRLVLLGEGPTLPELTRLAEELDVAERVRFVGWVDPPWTAAWNFDAVVVPSRVEGFGLVALEAMRAGIPVIASRVGGIPELIEDGSTGLLVMPEDPSALAAAIRQLAEDPAQRSVMAKRGAASIVGRFGTEAMAQAYEEVFDRARRRGPTSVCLRSADSTQGLSPARVSTTSCGAEDNPS